MDVDLTSDTNQFKAFIVSHSNRTINTIVLPLYDDGKKNVKVRRSTTDEQKVSTVKPVLRGHHKR